MGHQWKRVPFVKMLAFVLLGITASYLSGFSPDMSWIIAVFLATVLISVRSSPSLDSWLPSISQLLIFLFLFLGSSWLYVHHDERLNAAHFSHFDGADAKWVGAIQNFPDNSKWLKVVVSMRSLQKDTAQHQGVMGKVSIFLAPHDSMDFSRIVPGTLIAFEGQPQLIPPSNIPYTFDPAFFFGLQNIHHQLWCRADAWYWVDAPPEKSVDNALKIWQSKCVAQLKKHIKGDSESAIAAALVVGDRSYIDTETQTTYVNTGSIHVLAVSGLHVGFIAGILMWLTKWLPKRWKRIQFLRWLLPIIGVWMFVLLSGASPSVLRAGWMFSMLLPAWQMRKSYNMYNILAASAFLLLLFNPYLLFQPGFQLSYGAMLGIVTFFTPFRKLWHIEHVFGRKTWEMICVSLAAQLGTFPISLYYFQQFPVFFWLSGLVVIPLAIVILIGGWATILCSPLPYVSVWLGWIVNMVIAGQNWLLGKLEEVPYHVITGIVMTRPVLYSSLLLLVVLGWTVKTRQWRWMPYCMMGLLGLFSLSNITKYFQQRTPELLIQDAKGGWVIDYVSQGQSMQFRESEVETDFLMRKMRSYYASRFVASREEQVDSAKYTNLRLTCGTHQVVLWRDRFTVPQLLPNDIVLTRVLPFDSVSNTLLISNGMPWKDKELAKVQFPKAYHLRDSGPYFLQGNE